VFRFMAVSANDCFWLALAIRHTETHVRFGLSLCKNASCLKSGRTQFYLMAVRERFREFEFIVSADLEMIFYALRWIPRFYTA
jgi:hypothetical protein